MLELENKEYYQVEYDNLKQLQLGWKLLPNIAIFNERKEKGTTNEEILSVSAIKGIVKSSEYENRKDRTSEDKSQYLLVREGDLVYNTMLMWDGAVGHSSYRGIVSPAYTVLKPKIKINPKFFHYQMRTSFYKNYSKRFSYGIVDARLRLYYVNFKRMYSIVPPYKIQNTIVQYLDDKCDKIDGFIKNKKRLIDILETKKKSDITRIILHGTELKTEMYKTEIPYLPFVNRKSQIKRLKYLASLKGRIGFHGLKTSDFTIKGPFLVTGTDFIDGKVNWDTCAHITIKRYKEDPNIHLKNGDLLITKDGTIGKTAIVDKIPYEASLNSGVMLVRALKNEFLNKYLFWIINSRIFDEFIELNKTGSTVMHLYQHTFGNFKIPLPKLEEQEKIVNLIELEVTKINNAIEKARKEISSILEYRESLITELITGKRTISEN